MANIVNVTVESLETINTNSGGAQWVINRPKANYWKKVYLDSNRLYRYLRGQNKYTNLDSQDVGTALEHDVFQYWS